MHQLTSSHRPHSLSLCNSLSAVHLLMWSSSSVVIGPLIPSLCRFPLSLFSNLFSFLTVHLVPYLRRLYAGGSASIHHGKLHFACRQTVLYCLSCCISAQRAGETSGVSEICLLPAFGKNSSSIKDSGES